MNSNNLRNEVEKILDTKHCSSCLADNCYYEEEGDGIGVDICCFHQPEEATSQILSLLEGAEEKARVDELNKALTIAEDNQKSPFNMMECNNGEDLVYGVSEAYLHHRLQEIRSKMK